MPKNANDRLNAFLRNGFLALAALLLAYAALFAHFLHAFGQSVVHAKVIWLAIALAIFFAVTALRFSLKQKFKIFAVLACVLLLELLLQATAWLGVLPGVNTKLKAPYARVYWTAEGRGNGIRNRLGWYFPAFDLKAPHKIAYLGDSQIEAVEVARTQNQAADLQTRLKVDSPDWAVLGLGSHGTSPAFSIEVLEYAWRHFQPAEAIVTVSMGSDVTEALPAFNRIPPSAYLYYDFDPQGHAVLDPGCTELRDRFQQGLEFSHRSLLATAPVILNSHCMMLQLADSLRDSFYTRHRAAEMAALGNDANGFNPAPFAVNPSPEAQLALKLLIAQLAECKKVCDRHGMKFRVVTIPSFPRAFYQTQHGRDWTMRIGDYDYFGPERQIVAWANSNDIPVVSLGDVIQQKKMDVEEIRSLYFSNGSGHLTPKGHQFCADAVYDAFYRKPSR